MAPQAHAAAGLTWTRDPFDRMIAAHAIVADTPLLTADRTILDHLPLASWGWRRLPQAAANRNERR